MDKELFEVVENLVAFETEITHIEVVGFVAIGNINDSPDKIFCNALIKTGDEVVAVHEIDSLALDGAFFNLAGERQVAFGHDLEKQVERGAVFLDVIDVEYVRAGGFGGGIENVLHVAFGEF